MVYKSIRNRTGTRKPKEGCAPRDRRTERKILLDVEQFQVDAFGQLFKMLRTANRKENKQMADFTKVKERLASLLTQVAGLNDFKASYVAALNGMKAERDAVKAELEDLKAADAADQSEVDATEAALADMENTIAALEAVGEGTDVGGDESPGSQGGGSNEA